MTRETRVDEPQMRRWHMLSLSFPEDGDHLHIGIPEMADRQADAVCIVVHSIIKPNEHMR